MNKFIRKRTKIKCVSKSLEFVYTKLFSKDFKNHMKKPRGFESNVDRSILDADSESPT